MEASRNCRERRNYISTRRSAVQLSGVELLRILDECRAAGGGDCALATVVETKGSTYRRAGARLLIRRDRKTWGAISGGCLEADIVERALHVIARGETTIVRFKPADDDLIFGMGSGCQGEVAV